MKHCSVVLLMIGFVVGTISVTVAVDSDEVNWNNVEVDQITEEAAEPTLTPPFKKRSRKPIARIFGSEPITNQNEFAFQVGILSLDVNNKSSFCGGSVLSTQWILTAAHCLKNKISSKVYLGYYDLGKSNSGTRTSPVTAADYVIHNEHDSVTKKNDIALIRLKNPIRYSTSIQPIPLITKAESDNRNGFQGEEVLVSGWGALSNNYKDVAFTLRHARVQITDGITCQKSFKQTRITSTNICQSGAEAKGICYGDSGGPMTINVNGIKTLVGVSSFISSLGCESAQPRVYTRVSEYIDWITQNTRTQN